MSALAVVVLAAGKGTRMPAELPKVLHPVSGEPLIAHVLETVRRLQPNRIVLVLGHRAAEIEAAIATDDIEVVLQREQRGTGHAVRVTREALADFSGTVLVVYGDVPLLRAETLAELLELHRLENNAASILTASLEDPGGYGRIVRDAAGQCTGVVEQRDLAAGQEGIREINSGIIAFAAAELFPALERLRPDNASREYYLTDVIALLCQDGRRIGSYHLRDAAEILGVNTLEQLAEVERVHACRRRRPAPPCELCAAAAAMPAEGRADGDHLLLGGGTHAGLKVALAPFNNGHLLAFPRRHVTSLLSLTPEESAELGLWVRRGEQALRAVYACDALNMGCNSGVGGHFTFHIVPRWGGDVNFLPLLAGLKLVPETASQTWRRLAEVMP
jgi:CTP:molybdopterin cytidylyltransferase MocA/diadenosine tetraphosphate (Ap4A) HIT family hydrolase